MAYSIQTAVSDGTLEVLDLSIKYMDKSHIFVYVDDVLVDGSAYSYVWLTDTRIQVVPAVASGSTLKVIRKTLTDEMWHEFSKGARFSTTSMDENFEQLLFLAQEYSEGIYISDFYSDVDLHLKRILNLGDPINDTDAVNLKTLKEYLPNADLLPPILDRIEAEEIKSAQLISQGVTVSDKVIIGFDGTNIQDNAWVHFAGRDTVGDGGGGPLRFLKGSIATANGVTVYAVPGGRLVREGWSVFGINVKWAGAKGNPADDTAAFQAAINVANTIGGCRVYVPAGIYLINGTLTLYTKVEVIGEASGSTRIRQTNNSATLIKSYQFDTLTGGTSNGGIRRAAIKGLTLEASLSEGVPVGTNAQHGVQIYGYGNEIDDVHIRYFGGMGYYSEWRTPGVAPDSGYDDGFVEDRIGRLKCYQNGLSGIVRDGAHDGQWNRVISYSNNLADASTDKPNVWIKSKGNPQYIDQLHAWGSTSAVALLLEGSAKLSNCAIEGATAAQVRIQTGEVEISGGEIFVPGAGSSAKGIQFVGGTGVCIGYKIDTVIRGCNGGSIDFGAGIDAAEIKARIYQTSGPLFVGTMPSAGVGNSLEFTAAGGADNRGGTKKKHYHATLTNLSLADSTGEGLEYAQHGGEGVFAIPQRKTEPAGTYYPPSGVIGYGRVNAIRLHQSSSNTVGAILGEPATPVTPADNLDCSNYQLISLAASASSVTINNLVGGLNGSPFFLLMPIGGSEITLMNGTGNIRTKTGANLTRSGLGANRLISFVKARDGNYYQV